MQNIQYSLLNDVDNLLSTVLSFPVTLNRFKLVVQGKLWSAFK